MRLLLIFIALCALTAAPVARGELVRLETCPAQLALPRVAQMPPCTCSHYRGAQCCYFGETEALGMWLDAEVEQKYSLSGKELEKIQADEEPVRDECLRELEVFGCGQCDPQAHLFVDVRRAEFWVCPELCERFFQACVDVTLQRFVNAQTFCEKQFLHSGLEVMVRDFDCFNGIDAPASADSFAYGRGLYGGFAGLPNLFHVQAVDKYGNYKTRGGDAFVPHLYGPDSAVEAADEIVIVDNDDGTYNVSFTVSRQGRYTIDVTLDGQSIRNVPVQADFDAETFCPLKNDEPPRAENLGMCCEYANAACCDNHDLRPWGDDFEAIAVEWGGHPQCKDKLDHLLCGALCSPAQSRHVIVGEPNYNLTMGINDTTLHTLVLCEQTCKELFSACGGCPVSGVGLTVAAMYAVAEDFCKAVAPNGWQIELGDLPNCFDADLPAHPGGSFAKQVPDVTVCQVGEVVLAGETSVWLIQAGDVYGNLKMDDGGEPFQVRIDGPVDPQGYIVDNRNGTYTLTFDTTVVGAYDLYISLHGRLLVDAPFLSRVWPAERAPQLSEVHGPATWHPTRVNRTTYFLVGAKDVYNNDMLVGEFTYDVSASGPAPLDFSMRHLENGTTLYEYRPTEAGEYTVRVSADGQEVMGSPFFVVIWPELDGELSAEHTFADGAGLHTAEAGVTARFTVHARNQYDLVRDAGGDQLAVTILGPPRTGPVEMTPRPLDNMDGTYTVAYVVTTGVGAYVIDVRDALTNERISTSPSVVIVGEPSAKNAPCVFSIDESSLSGATFSEPVLVGRMTNFTITARDVSGNVMRDGGVEWRVMLEGGDQFAVASEAMVHDNLDGTYTVTFAVPLDAGDYTLSVQTVDGAHLDESPYTISVGANELGDGAFDNQYTRVIGPGLTTARVGRATHVTVVAKDKFAVQMPFGGVPFTATFDGEPLTVVDNMDGTYTVRYTPTRAGSQELRVQVDGDANVTPTPMQVDVLAFGEGVLRAANTTVYGDGFRQGQTGAPLTFFVDLKDARGMPYTGDASVEIVVNGDAFTSYLVPDLLNNNNGTYTATYRVSVAGTYIVSVAVNGEHVTDGEVIVTSSMGGGGNNGRIDSTRAQLAIHSVGVAAHTNTMQLTTVDALGDKLPHGGADVSVSLVGPERLETRVVDAHDGTYTIEYTPLLPGLFDVLVHVNGQHVKTAAQVRVVREEGVGQLDVRRTIAYGDGLVAASLGKTVRVGIVAVDKAGFPCTADNVEFRVRLHEVGSSHHFDVPVHARADGTFEARYRVAHDRVEQYVAEVRELRSDTIVWPTPSLVTVVDAEEERRDPMSMFSAAKSLLSGEGLRTAITGERATFTIVSRDAHKQQLPSGGLRFSAYLDGPARLNVSVVDRLDGTYEASYDAPIDGEYMLVVQVDGERVGDRVHRPQVAALMDVHASLVDASALPTKKARVGHTYTVTLVARDTQARNLTTGGAGIVAYVSAHAVDREHVVRLPALVVDHRNGTYALSFVVPSAGDYQLHAALGDVPLFEPLAFTAVSKQGDDAEERVHSIVLALVPDAIVPDVDYEFELRAVDKQGATVPSVALPLAVTMEVGERRLSVDVAHRSDGRATAHFSVPSTLLGAAKLRHVVASVSVGRREMSRQEMSVRKAYVGAPDAPMSSEALTSERDVSSTMSYAFAPATAMVGVDIRVGVQLRDMHGAAIRTDTLDAKKVSMQLRGPPSSGPALLEPEFHASGARGVFVAHLTVTLTPGTYLLYAAYGKRALGNAPLVIDVQPSADGTGVFDPLKSFMDGALAPVGEVSVFTVTGVDPNGHVMSKGGAQLDAVMAEPHGRRAASVVDHNDGTYSVSFVAREPGTHQLSVVVRGTGVPIGGLTLRSTIAGDQVFCPALWDGSSTGYSFAVANEATKFFVKPVDCDGQAVSEPPSAIDLQAPGEPQRIRLILLGPSGLPLTQESRTSFQMNSLDQLDDGSYLFAYQGDVFGAAKLSVQVDGIDIQNSPTTVVFSGEQSNCGGATATNVYCSGHGVCVESSGACVCERGWTGDVCDGRPPPSADSAVFAPSGRSLVVHFDEATNTGGETIGEDFQCAVVFDAADLGGLLGDGASCVWLTASELSVSLGASPTLNVGDELRLKNDLIGSADNTGALVRDAVLMVRSPRDAPGPLINVVGPTKISQCVTEAVFDATSSTGFGGRPMPPFTWSLNEPLASDAERVTAKLAGTTGARLILTRADLDALRLSGQRTLTVRATNLFGVESSTSFDIEAMGKTSQALINDAKVIRLWSNVDFTLDSDVQVFDAECAQPAGATVVAFWGRRSGPPFVNENDVEFGARRLTLPSGTLTPGQTYVVELTAEAFIDTPNGPVTLGRVTDTVTILAQGSSVSARLMPTGERQLARSEPIVLDASASIDYADLPEAFSFFWSCHARNEQTRPCFSRSTAAGLFGDETGNSNSRVVIPPAFLAPDVYTFSVEVCKGDQGINCGTDTATIVYSFDDVPTVTITALGGIEGDVVDPHRSFILLGNATSLSGKPLVTTWTVTPEPLLPYTMSEDGLALSVPRDSLRAGLTYTFELRGADESGEGVARKRVYVNEGPSGGACQLQQTDTPPIAYSTEFTVRCQNWEDRPDQMPLRYYYTYTRASDDSEVPLVVDPVSTATRAGIRVPSSATGLVVYVMDGVGGATRVALTQSGFRVEAGDVDVDELIDEIEAALTSSGGKDLDTAAQLANVALSAASFEAAHREALALLLEEQFTPLYTEFNAYVRALLAHDLVSVAEDASLKTQMAALTLVAEATERSFLPPPVRGADLRTLTLSVASHALSASNAFADADNADELALDEEERRDIGLLSVAQVDRVAMDGCAQLISGAGNVELSGGLVAVSVERVDTQLLEDVSLHGNTVSLDTLRAQLDSLGVTRVCVQLSQYGFSAERRANPFEYVAESAYISSGVLRVGVRNADTAALELVELRDADDGEARFRVELVQRGRAPNRPFECGEFDEGAEEWLLEETCEFESSEEREDGYEVVRCLCTSLSSHASLVGSVGNVTAGAGVAGEAGELIQVADGFVVDWAQLAVALIGLLFLLCCFCVLWYLRRKQMRYDYLEGARDRDVEEPRPAYPSYFSDEEREEASLLLRKPLIEISESVSSSAPSGDTSELEGRGGGSTSSSYTTSGSELGRSDLASNVSSSDVSASELGASHSRATQSSSSSRTHSELGQSSRSSSALRSSYSVSGSGASSSGARRRRQAEASASRSGSASANRK